MLKTSESVRLNRYIALCGLASRRHADELIEKGKVLVNGRKVFELGIKVDPKKDKVTVDGRPVQQETKKIYLLFNKPKFILTSMSDPTDRPTVGDFFQRVPFRVFPVGRLDWDSEGMLILTNDGDYSYQISHPTSQIPKTYLVKVDGHPSESQLEKLKRGVSTAVGRVHALDVEVIRRGDSENYDWIRIIIDEGRNRQVRRMFEKLGYDVLKLQRVAIGELSIGSLKKGEFRVLSAQEAKKALSTTPRASTKSHGKKTRVLARPKRKLDAAPEEMARPNSRKARKTKEDFVTAKPDSYDDDSIDFDSGDFD
jgi:23S rRNA pseudouridine2605 synthase